MVEPPLPHRTTLRETLKAEINFLVRLKKETLHELVAHPDDRNTLAKLSAIEDRLTWSMYCHRN